MLSKIRFALSPIQCFIIKKLFLKYQRFYFYFTHIRLNLQMHCEIVMEKRNFWIIESIAKPVLFLLGTSKNSQSHKYQEKTFLLIVFQDCPKTKDLWQIIIGARTFLRRWEGIKQNCQLMMLWTIFFQKVESLMKHSIYHKENWKKSNTKFNNKKEKRSFVKKQQKQLFYRDAKNESKKMQMTLRR